MIDNKKGRKGATNKKLFAKRTKKACETSSQNFNKKYKTELW
jgi:hypothetical protein